MDALFEFGLEAVRSLQAAFPFLLQFFLFVSALGTEIAFLLFIPLLYWCLHKEWGRHFAYIFLLSNFLNFALKHTFRGPRPFWLAPELNLGGEAIGYGVPSGHSQTATVIGLFFANKIKKRWMWWLAIFYIAMMLTSRVFLGHHFVHDVAAGLLLGVLVFLGYWLWIQNAHERFRRRILGFRLLIAVLLPLGLAGLYTAVLFLIGEPTPIAPWAGQLAAAELESLEGVVTMLASLLGAGIGLTLEKSRVRFRVEGEIWRRALRYLVGIFVAVVIWAGLDAVFPAEPLPVALTFRVVRYALLTLWLTYYAPAFFVWLRLASADPEPEISLKL